MNFELLAWIFGVVCGLIGSSVVFAFKLGALVSDNKAAMTALSESTCRLNELIASIKKDHEEHEKKSETQVNALWKAQDALRERIVILESEMKSSRRDIEILAGR